jgi:hypothetical protein
VKRGRRGPSRPAGATLGERRLKDNGQGAVSTRSCLAELPSLIDEIAGGGTAVTNRAVPLADVETAWTAPESAGVRTVLMPSARPLRRQPPTSNPIKFESRLGPRSLTSKRTRWVQSRTGLSRP